MAMMSSAGRHLRLACSAALIAALAPASARADFFDDARRTFTTDIPHFFQDDIPCAFGGQPTSHAKTSCKSPDHPPRPAADKDRATVPPPPAPLPPDGEAHEQAAPPGPADTPNRPPDQ